MEKIIENCDECPFYTIKENSLGYYCKLAIKTKMGYKIPINCPLCKSPMIVRLKDDIQH